MAELEQVDVSRSILQHFGAAPHRGSSIIPPRTRQIVLWVVDGLGLSLFESARSHDLVFRIATHAPRLLPARSVYPSTTAAGLATLAFAKPPAGHGALGYWIYLPEIDRTVNMLSGRDLAGNLAPEPLLYPHLPNLFEKLAERGFRSAVVGPAEHRDSGLTRWLYHHADYVPYDPAIPLHAVQQAHEALSDHVDFVWLYWPHIDQSAHTTGIDSVETRHALTEWDEAYHRAVMLWSEHPRVSILVTADHGMMALDPRQVIGYSDSRAQPIWRHRWAGERRALTSELAADTLARTWSDSAKIVPQETAWTSGWYGGPPARPTWRSRTLNTLILAQPSAQFEQDVQADIPILKAAHGGITDEERRIPLLIQHWGERLNQ